MIRDLDRVLTHLSCHMRFTNIWPELGCWCACKQTVCSFQRLSRRNAVKSACGEAAAVWRCYCSCSGDKPALNAAVWLQRARNVKCCKVQVVQFISLLVWTGSRVQPVCWAWGAVVCLLCLQLPLCTFRLSRLCSCLKSFGIFNETQAAFKTNLLLITCRVMLCSVMWPCGF